MQRRKFARLQANERKGLGEDGSCYSQPLALMDSPSPFAEARKRRPARA
jgi:hypothetical protein